MKSVSGKERKKGEIGKKIAAIIVGVSIGVVHCAAFIACGKALSVKETFAESGGVKVVLDAGHGGVDGGVTGRTSGVKESDLNLKIVYLAAEKLSEVGFEVILTRKTEEGLYGAATKGFKKRDMLRRKEIIEAEEPTIVVSVHQNYYPSGFSRGAQAFYKKGSEEGMALAERLQEAFNALYGAKGVKKRNAATGDFFMLSCSDCPSALIECGFLSNVKDEALLCDGAFQRAAAQAIVEGVVGFIGDAHA